jgi:hypothetical protein
LLNDAQDVIPFFGAPAAIILFSGIGGQIDETTLAAPQAGKRLFHNFFLSVAGNISLKGK